MPEPEPIVTQVLAALDRGHRIELRATAPPAFGSGGVQVIVSEETEAGTGYLTCRLHQTRAELTDGVGAYALAYTIAQASRAITEAPRPAPGE